MTSPMKGLKSIAELVQTNPGCRDIALQTMRACAVTARQAIRWRAAEAPDVRSVECDTSKGGAL
jgi:hypothetical protein